MTPVGEHRAWDIGIVHEEAPAHPLSWVNMARYM